MYFSKSIILVLVVLYGYNYMEAMVDFRPVDEPDRYTQEAANMVNKAREQYETIERLSQLATKEEDKDLLAQKKNEAYKRYSNLDKAYRDYTKKISVLKKTQQGKQAYYDLMGEITMSIAPQIKTISNDIMSYEAEIKSLQNKYSKQLTTGYVPQLAIVDTDIKNFNDLTKIGVFTAKTKVRDQLQNLKAVAAQMLEVVDQRGHDLVGYDPKGTKTIVDILREGQEPLGSDPKTVKGAVTVALYDFNQAVNRNDTRISGMQLSPKAKKELFVQEIKTLDEKYKRIIQAIKSLSAKVGEKPFLPDSLSAYFEKIATAPK